MMNVKEARAKIDATLNEAPNSTAHASAYAIAKVARGALNEIEAMRKPVAPSAFDVAAARAELARIEATRPGLSVDALAAFRAMGAFLDRALDAPSQGWEPTGDVVERAAKALLIEKIGDHLDAESAWDRAIESSGTRNICRREARAVLRSAGRLPEPVAITDEVVEEAAARAWCANDDGRTIETWKRDADGSQRANVRREARAVLEYAASKGIAPASPASDDGTRWRREAEGWERIAVDRATVIHRLKTEAETRCSQIVGTTPAPVDIRLTCPACGVLHIDEGVFSTKPHHTHSCQGCGLTWRPCVGFTRGVQFLPGFKNDVDTSHGGAFDGYRMSQQSQTPAPVDTGIAARLTAYRSAIANGMLAVGDELDHDAIENEAHAMLAAERPVKA